jgi:hypothetical protein
MNASFKHSAPAEVMLGMLLPVRAAATRLGAGADVRPVAAKTAPVWPKTAAEMNNFLKVEGKAIPDALTGAWAKQHHA